MTSRWKHNCARMHTGTKTQRQGGTEALKHRGTEAQRHRSTEAQRHKDRAIHNTTTQIHRR
eukprot:7545320-Alexandrium_andersonii.AAC.1